MTVRIPKYRLHKASGQALVEIAGRRLYLGKHGSEASQEAYRRAIAALVIDEPRSQGIAAEAPSNLTINALILAYYRHAQTYYMKDGAPTDELAALRAIFRRLRAHYGQTTVASFGPRAFKLLRDSLIAEGLSRKYVNDSMARIRRMFRWGVAEEIVPVAIHQAITSVPGLRRGRSLARESAPVLPVEDEVVEVTLAHVGDVVGDMIRLQRLSGMRPSEVCNIRPRDVDRSGPIWEYRPHTHKTEHKGKERLVFFGPKAQAILVNYIDRPPSEYCFQPSESEVPPSKAQSASMSPLTAQ